MVRQSPAQNGTSNQGGVGGNLGQNGGDSPGGGIPAVLELLLMVGHHIEWVNLVMAMETFEAPKSIEAMKDLTQQTLRSKEFDIDTGAFDVYYNDET